MVRRIAIASLLVPAAVAAFALVSASPGLAAGQGNCIATTGAEACYVGRLERLTVTDTLRDGHHVRAYWSVTPSAFPLEGHFDNGYGNGKSRDLNFDRTIPSYGTICFRAATMEGDTIVKDGSGRQLLSPRKCLPVQ